MNENSENEPVPEGQEPADFGPENPGPAEPVSEGPLSGAPLPPPPGATLPPPPGSVPPPGTSFPPPGTPLPPQGGNYHQAGAPGGGYGQGGYAPGGPFPQQGAPFGVDPFTGIPFSDKSKLIAGLLQILLPFGIGRMYIGDVGVGVAQLLVSLLTCGFGSLWSIIDGILILVGQPKDEKGLPLR